MNFSGTLRVNKFACFTVAFIVFLIIYWRSGSNDYPKDTSDLINLKSLLKSTIHAAQNGGVKVVEAKNKQLDIKSKGKTLEGVNDPVTNADFDSHCTMFYSLIKTFPKLTVVSEEHSVKNVACENQKVIDTDSVIAGHESIEYMNNEHVYIKDVTVWIDPLDATQEYTESLYNYVTTMACVAIKGVPIIGVIHYPFSQETYWAWYTKKASANIPQRVYNEENKNHPKIVISRSHPGKVAETAKQVFGPQSSVSTAAGAGFKVMEVINGTYDLYFHTSIIKKWDICAGDAIVKTLNGKMSTVKGDMISYMPEADVKVSDGVLVAMKNHEFYLDKLRDLVTDAKD